MRHWKSAVFHAAVIGGHGHWNTASSHTSKSLDCEFGSTAADQLVSYLWSVMPPAYLGNDPVLDA
jgi:hypothetical protein